MYWRKAVLADVLLLLMAPLEEPADQAAHVAHMVDTLASDTPLRSTLSSSALPAFLPSTPVDTRSMVRLPSALTMLGFLGDVKYT